MGRALLVALFAAAVVGAVILRWRRTARASFGLGVVNQPNLVASDFGNIAVLLVGLALVSVPTIIILRTVSWLAGIACLAVALVLGTPMADLIARGNLAEAHRRRAGFEKQYSGDDAVTAAMKMHLKNGTITQAQFDEFVRTKGRSSPVE